MIPPSPPSASAPTAKPSQAGAHDSTVRVWDLATGKELQRLSHDDHRLRRQLQSRRRDPRKRELRQPYACGFGHRKELQRLSHDFLVTAVSFTPSGKTLASGSKTDRAGVGFGHGEKTAAPLVAAPLA